MSGLQGRDLGPVGSRRGFPLLLVTGSIAFHTGGGAIELLPLGLYLAFGGFEVRVELEGVSTELAQFFEVGGCVVGVGYIGFGSCNFWGARGLH